MRFSCDKQLERQSKKWKKERKLLLRTIEEMTKKAEDLQCHLDYAQHHPLEEVKEEVVEEVVEETEDLDKYDSLSDLNEIGNYRDRKRRKKEEETFVFEVARLFLDGDAACDRGGWCMERERNCTVEEARGFTNPLTRKEEADVEGLPVHQTLLNITPPPSVLRNCYPYVPS